VNEVEFWTLIESSKAAAKGSFDLHCEELAKRLVELPPDEIVAFDKLFRGKSIQAYTWDLWGAAYVINGGCSDDGFNDFRSWLISLGRDRFERALADPESLVDVKLGPGGEEDASFEQFSYVATEAYETATSDPLPDEDDGIEFPDEPAGEPWDEDEEVLAERYPKLSAKYGAQ
jgi:hypothetical protein